MSKNPIIALVLFLLFSANANAQKFLTPANRLLIKKAELALKVAGDSLLFSKNDSEKIKQAALIGEKLDKTLAIPYSSAYGFDSLKTVRVSHSIDHKLRLFTWFIPFADGTYQFFGRLQLNTGDGKLAMFKLTDSTKTLSDEQRVTNNNNWYGASYGNIIPVATTGKPTYYLLLGWKGNDQQSSKKVIDVLSFEKGNPVFGKSIFETSTKGVVAKRVVFEYSNQNHMSLYFDKFTKAIIFDHLSPISPDYKGQFKYYGSDLTFDSYQISYGRLKFQENIELKNEATDIDEFYIQPVKASRLLKKKP